jgi:hypothetical protein
MTIPRRLQEVIDKYEASSTCPESISDGFILDFNDNDWENVWMAPELNGREDDLMAFSRVEQAFMKSTILQYLTTLLSEALWYYRTQLGLVLVLYMGGHGGRFQTLYKWIDTLFPGGRFNKMARIYNTPDRSYLILTSVIYTHLQVHIPDTVLIKKASRRGQKIAEAEVKMK